MEKLYITRITLHVKGFRPTTTFSKVKEKGILYSALSSDSFNKPITGNDNIRNLRIDLPEDLMEKVRAGTLEIMIPKEGLQIYAGRDTIEKAQHEMDKERNMLIHKSRGKTWRADDKGVK